MVYLAKFLSSLLRIILLLLGMYLALLLSFSGVQAINAFLSSQNYPCLEVISGLVIIIPPLAILYGQHIRKFFWQRVSHYNAVILAVSLLVGVLIAFLPQFLSTSVVERINHCAVPSDFAGILTYVFGTALITAVLTFLGVDLGVILKHLSLRLHHKPNEKKKVSRRKKRRK